MIEDLLAYIVQRCEELAIEIDDADARAAVALYRSLMDGSAGAKELDNWLRTHHMAEPEPVPDAAAWNDVTTLPAKAGSFSGSTHGPTAHVSARRPGPGPERRFSLVR